MVVRAANPRQGQPVHGDGLAGGAVRTAQRRLGGSPLQRRLRRRGAGLADRASARCRRQRGLDRGGLRGGVRVPPGSRG